MKKKLFLYIIRYLINCIENQINSFITWYWMFCTKFFEKNCMKEITKGEKDRKEREGEKMREERDENWKLIEK